MTKENRARVLWVHNYGTTMGSFMWDVWDSVQDRQDFEFSEHAIPLRPSLFALPGIVTELRRHAESVDVIHAQYGSLVGLIAAMGGKPLVLSLRGSDMYIGKQPTFLTLLDSYLRIFISWVATLCAREVVVMSRRMRRDLRRWPLLGSKRTVIVTDPIGEVFLPPHRADVGTEAETLRVFSGSLLAQNPVKRTWIIDEAARLCNGAGVNVQLEFVTGQPRAEVRAKLESCDVIALASTHEGWPNIIKEAMACGLTFVATDVSDLADLVEPSKAHQIVDPTPEDFALAFAEMATAKRLTGRADDLTVRYHPSRAAAQHIIVYNAALRRGREA